MLRTLPPSQTPCKAPGCRQLASLEGRTGMCPFHRAQQLQKYKVKNEKKQRKKTAQTLNYEDLQTAYADLRHKYNQLKQKFEVLRGQYLAVTGLKA